MATKPNNRVMNGHPKLDEAPTYQVPTGRPNQTLIMPQQQQMVPQQPQLPVISEANLVGLQQAQLAIMAMPAIIPLVAPPPMHFINTVAEKMDEISNYSYGEDEFDFVVEIKF